ncbi:terpenoid synthase [Lentinus tigrinus ALCF2SS1-6]|uniref:Terpenoid synthase n=1 Tax=Lentinus tigrinus ALCF2SS1-6 TaxID=1328759 RepID=A0A5C2SEN8_9APHY|nr:terpenoid synthase [Lentinus tigrinus ALCF2SS1-6]
MVCRSGTPTRTTRLLALRTPTKSEEVPGIPVDARCYNFANLHTDPHLETRDIIRDFLKRSKYEPHVTPPNAGLRAAVTECIVAWKSSDSVEAIEKLVDSACAWAETGYGHTSPQHLHYIALYTAVILYIDDVGGEHLDAIRQFAARFIWGEKQLSPALDTLVDLMRGAHQLWTDVGADAIIAGTLDAVTAMYIEYTTQDMEIKPQATLYPYYLRTRSGICPPYIHFIFMSSWRATADTYMERWVVGANDILSFYKEQLAGETKNYMHMRACAEQTTPVQVLRTLCEEVLECDRKVLALSAGNNELADLWKKYVQGTLEFHANTRRYRLFELGFSWKEKEL